jgi:hypothetical protein
LKGWEFAARNKEYTLDLVIAEMKQGASSQQQSSPELDARQDA